MGLPTALFLTTPSINAEVSIIKESDTTITADNQVSFTTDNTYENRYFSFTPEISGDYNLNVVGGSFALTLYDKNGKILTSPTSINDKLDLRYKLNGGEIYYYHIKNYTNSSFTLILTKCQVPVTDIEIIECTATVDTSGHVAGVSIIYEAPVGSCFSMGISCGTDTSCDGYSTTVSVPYSVKERDIIDFTFKHLNPNTTYYYTTTIVDSSAFYYGEVYSFTTGDSMSLTLNEGKAEKYFPLIDKNYYYNYTPSSDGIYSINLSALINDYSVLDRDNIQGHGTIYVRAKGDYYGVERNRTLDIPFYTYLKGGQTYYIEATILGFSVDKFVLTVKAYTPINLELDEIVRISSEGQYEYCYSYIPSVTGVYSFYDSTASIDIFNSETDYIMRNISQTDDTYQKRAFLISGRQYYIRLFVTHEDDYYLIVEKENRPSAGSVPVTVELDGWEYLRFYPEESGLYEITVSQCDTQTDPNPHISTKIITSNGDILYEKENSVKSLTTYYFLSEDTEYFIACYSNSTERYKVTATLPYALTADTTVSVDAKAFTESVYLFTPITNGIYSFKVNCSKGYLLLYNSDNILLDTKFSVDGNIQLPYSLISGVKYYCQFCSDFQGSYNLTVTDYKENVTNPKITVGSVSINISSGNEYRMFIPEKTGFYEISLSLINSDGDIASDATGVINADLLDQWGNTLYTSNSVGGDVTLICWLESGLNYYLKWNTEYSGILTITVTEPIELKLGVQINIITETDSDYYYYFTPPMSGCYNLSASDYIGSFTLYNADGIVTGPQNSSADKISYSYEYSIGEAYCFKFSLKSGSHAAIMLNYRIYTGSMNGMNGTIYTALYDDQGKMLETIRLNSSVLDYDDLPAEAARCKFFCLNEKWQPMCESEERIFERIIS